MVLDCAVRYTILEMESHDNKDNEDDDDFFDTLPDFPSENCSVTDQPQLSTSPSSDSSPLPEISSQNAPSAVSSLRRRPSVRRRIEGEIPTSDSSISSLTTTIDDSVKMSPKGKTLKFTGILMTMERNSRDPSLYPFKLTRRHFQVA